MVMMMTTIVTCGRNRIKVLLIIFVFRIYENHDFSCDLEKSIVDKKNEVTLYPSVPDIFGMNVKYLFVIKLVVYQLSRIWHFRRSLNLR